VKVFCRIVGHRYWHRVVTQGTGYELTFCTRCHQWHTMVTP
jgi:hypothetical protein